MLTGENAEQRKQSRENRGERAFQGSGDYIVERRDI
jgi:hypothetical protein